MSTATPRLRACGGPRWSVAKLSGLEPWSMHGLPLCRACVSVRLPLLARGSRSGSRPNSCCVVVSRLKVPATAALPIRQRVAVKAVEVDESRSEGSPLASFSATMLLSRVTLPSLAKMPPPLELPSKPPWLKTMVLLWITSGDWKALMDPPRCVARFPEIVLLRRLKGEGELTYMAPPPSARLSRKVQPVTVEVPPRRSRPPPLKRARFPLIVLLV